MSVRDRESRRDGGLAAELVDRQGNPTCVFLGLPRAGERHTAPRGGGCAGRGRPMPVGYHGNSSWWARQPEEARSGFLTAWERDEEEGVGKRDYRKGRHRVRAKLPFETVKKIKNHPL